MIEDNLRHRFRRLRLRHMPDTGQQNQSRVGNTILKVVGICNPYDMLIAMAQGVTTAISISQGKFECLVGTDLSRPQQLQPFRVLFHDKKHILSRIVR